MADADAESIADIPVPSAGDLEGLLDDSGTDESEEADDQEEQVEDESPKKKQPAKKQPQKKEAPKEGETEEEDDTSEGEESDEADENQAEDEVDETEELDEGDDESEDDDEKTRNREGYARRTRAQIKASVTEQLDGLAKPQSVEQLMETGNMDQALAEIEAMKQQQQRRDVIDYVTNLNTDLNLEASDVVRDFSVYDENSPDYDEKFTKEVEERWKAASRFRTDPSGRFVTNAEIPLYDFYSWAAELRGNSVVKGVKKGRVEGQKAAEKMLGAAESPASSAPKTNDDEKDPFLKGLLGKGNHS